MTPTSVRPRISTSPPGNPGGMLRTRTLLVLLALAAALLPSAAVAQEPDPARGRPVLRRPGLALLAPVAGLPASRRDAQGRPDRKIAREPKALWLGRFTRPNFAVKVRRLIDPAKARGEVPIFTVLRAEAIGCSPSYQGGGPAADAATRAWYDDLARVIGDDRVVIAFEPDSLGTIDCLARSRRDDRLRLLRYGVDALSRLPNATVYLEAGASDWESAAAHGAASCARSGSPRCAASCSTPPTTTGRRRTSSTASTSRAGPAASTSSSTPPRTAAGPCTIEASNRRRITVWCNPGLRGLGPAPTTDTIAPEGGRLPVDQPSGLRPVVPGPPDRLVSAAGAQLCAQCDDWERRPPGTTLRVAPEAPAVGLPLALARRPPERGLHPLRHPRDHEVVGVLDHVEDELVGHLAVDLDRVPVALVEVVAGPDG